MDRYLLLEVAVFLFDSPVIETLEEAENQLLLFGVVDLIHFEQVWAQNDHFI